MQEKKIGEKNIKKQFIKKLIYVFILLIMLISIGITNLGALNHKSYAAYSMGNIGERSTETPLINEASSSTGVDPIKFTDAGKLLITGIISIVAWILRLLIFIVFFVVSIIISAVLDGNMFGTFTIDKILFNDYDLINIDFFSGGSNAIEGFAANISTWFRILFAAGLIIQLAVLVYTAIRAIIDGRKGFSKEEMPYKVLVKNFIRGIILTFSILIFSIAMIKINNVIVRGLRNTAEVTDTLDLTKLIISIFAFDITEGSVGLIIYIIIQVMAIMFFFYYLKRMMTVAFLVIISPLVVSTYALEQSKGGAVKFQTWLKMFMYNVFIQVFHVIIFLSLVSVTYESATKGENFIQAVIFSIAGIKFIWDAEKIITQLFGIEAAPASGSAVATMTTLLALQNLGKTAEATASRPKNVKPQVTRLAPNPNTPGTHANKAQGAYKGAKQTARREAMNKKFELDEAAKKAKSTAKTPDLKIRRKQLNKEYGKILPDKQEMMKKTKHGIDVGKSYAKTKIKNVKRDSGDRVLKRAAAFTVAGVAAIASNASPDVDMLQAGIMGYALGTRGHEKIRSINERKKYDPLHSGPYKRTVSYEAEQLDALIDRKEALTGEDMRAEKPVKASKKKEKADDEVKESEKIGENFEEVETEKQSLETSEEGYDNIENRGYKEDISSEEDSEIIIETGVERYVDEITKKSVQKIDQDYKEAKKEAISSVIKHNKKTALEATRAVEDVEEKMYKNGRLNYHNMNPEVKNFLSKSVDKTLKEKIEYFVHTGIDERKVHKTQMNDAIAEAEARYKRDTINKLKDK